MKLSTFTGIKKKLKLYYQLLTVLFNPKYHYIASSLKYIQINKKLNWRTSDFIRISTLELCANEIQNKNLKGSVAELGVYRAEFAKLINMVFPDRPFYLFDTFSGFNTKDAIFDIQNQFSKGNQDFSRTNETLVIEKMKYPHTCLIKKGHFPETSNDVHDQFAFVSIDADLYESILSGLNFFYPLMVVGGYIFIHDYNNDEYKGVKEAVTAFSRTYPISFIPIADIGGSIIIMK